MSASAGSKSTTTAAQPARASQTASGNHAPAGGGPVLGLHRAAGNHSVSSLLGGGADPGGIPRAVDTALQGPSEALPEQTRSEMEQRFGQDFGGVRVHLDAASARSVNANAYTVGEHIVFDSGLFAPATPSGKTLLAHELTHVVQQTRASSFVDRISDPRDSFERHARNDQARGPIPSGPMPRVLRQEKAQEPSAAALETDDFTSTLIGIAYGDTATGDTGALLASGKVLQNDFTSGGPKTRVTAARILTETNRVLHERERTAKRDAHGALMRQSFMDEVPWTEAKPHHTEEISPFTPANVAQWTSVALAAERPKPTVSGAAPAKAKAAAPAAAKQEDAKPETPASSGLTVGTNLTPDGQPEESETAGGSEITAGLAALKSVTVEAAANALEARANEITPGTKLQAPQSPKASLYSTSGAVFYIGNRIYAVDRSGHIIPSGFAFDMQGTSLKGGTYFAAPFAVRAKGINQVSSSMLLLRIDGGTVEAVGGDVYPSAVNTGLLPILQLMRASVANGGGVAVIVSNHRKKQTIGNISFRRVVQAMKLVPHHLSWAIRSQVKAMIANPAETIAQFAMSEALAELAKRLPPIALGLKMFQALKQVVWLADTANIAAYALTDDEVDLAAQGMAVELAGYIIGKIIEAGKAVARAGVRAITTRVSAPAVRSGGSTSGAESNSGGPNEETAQAGGSKQSGNTPPPTPGQEATPVVPAGDGQKPATPTQNLNKPNLANAGGQGSAANNVGAPKDNNVVPIETARARRQAQAAGGGQKPGAAPPDLRQVNPEEFGGQRSAANDVDTPNQAKSNVVPIETAKAAQQAQPAVVQRAAGSDIDPDPVPATRASASRGSGSKGSGSGRSNPPGRTTTPGATGGSGGVRSTAAPKTATPGTATPGTALPSASPIDYDHVIGADYNKNGQPTGGHSLLKNDVRIVPGTETAPDPYGVYRAAVQMPDPNNAGAWITKSASVNTMFPKNWTEAQIKAEVDAAWNSPNKVVSGTKWQSVTPSGVKVSGYTTPRTTVFPIYQGSASTP
jgi:hypothetical protein